MPSAKDQHPVGGLSAGGEHEPFGIGVRAGTAGRDLHYLDAGAGEGRIEGFGELPGAVPDQEPEVRGAAAEVHQEIAYLLGSPWPVRVRGDSGDVQVTRTDLDNEQHVQALERDRAVNMEEVGGEHGRGLHVQELLPAQVGVPLRGRRILEALTRWPSFSSSPWILW